MKQSKFYSSFQVFSSFFCLMAAAVLVFEFQKDAVAEYLTFLRMFDLVLIVFFIMDICIGIVYRTGVGDFLRAKLVSLCIVSVLVFLAVWHPSSSLHVFSSNVSAIEMLRAGIIIRGGLLILRAIASLAAIRDFFANVSINPAKNIIFGFLMVIFVGAVLLSLPVSLADGKSISFLDALFTSASAVCVTGLIVVDTGTHFSVFGQTVIMLLIQTGGIGIMTLVFFAGMFMRERLSLRERKATQNFFEEKAAPKVYVMVRRIIVIVLGFELLGFLALFIHHSITGAANPAHNTAFYSLFHAVSAFCNAGFSLNAESLMGISSDFFGNMIFIFLIISGGIGFMVILNVKRHFFTKKTGAHFTKKRGERLSLHTRIVLIVTVILLLTGTVVFFAAENSNTLAGMNAGEKWLASFFQSTTARTAGFNTVDTGALRPVTMLFFLILMFIGASPGSTGGGIKTTTFAVMIMTVWALLREKDDVNINRRTIPRDIINKVIAILLLFIAMVFGASLIILFVEADFEPLHVLFEVVSAAGTVGLSTGITNALSSFSKIVIITVMFLGRIGPLTLVLAMSLRKRTHDHGVRYPEERIQVG